MTKQMPPIPEILIDKITLMAYGLSPHPLAQIIKKSQKIHKLCENMVYNGYEHWYKNGNHNAAHPTEREYLGSQYPPQIYDKIETLFIRLNAWNDLKWYMIRNNYTKYDNKEEMICCFMCHIIRNTTIQNRWVVGGLQDLINALADTNNIQII